MRFVPADIMQKRADPEKLGIKGTIRSHGSRQLLCYTRHGATVPGPGSILAVTVQQHKGFLMSQHTRLRFPLGTGRAAKRPGSGQRPGNRHMIIVVLRSGAWSFVFIQVVRDDQWVPLLPVLERVPMHTVRRKSGHAYRNILRAVRAWRAVLHPFSLVRDNGLSGLNIIIPVFRPNAEHAF